MATTVILRSSLFRSKYKNTLDYFLKAWTNFGFFWHTYLTQRHLGIGLKSLVVILMTSYFLKKVGRQQCLIIENLIKVNETKNEAGPCSMFHKSSTSTRLDIIRKNYRCISILRSALRKNCAAQKHVRNEMAKLINWLLLPGRKRSIFLSRCGGYVDSQSSSTAEGFDQTPDDWARTSRVRRQIEHGDDFGTCAAAAASCFVSSEVLGALITRYETRWLTRVVSRRFWLKKQHHHPSAMAKQSITASRIKSLETTLRICKIKP